MHHWYSTFTGEIIEDFPKLISNIIKTLRAYWDKWSMSDRVKYVVCWKYSRIGF